MRAKPLNGIGVLDLTRLLPGAVCTLHLADMGADVVKIEDPWQGDYGRSLGAHNKATSPYFLVSNRNKRGLKLECKYNGVMTASLHIGEFDAPILVFGGPYSNLEATEALMAAAESRNIPADHMLCTGDVVAYGAEPQATVDLIRAAGIAVVMGNCEESLGGDLSDCGCGFEKGSPCDVLATQWFAYASRALDVPVARSVQPAP